LRSIDRADWHYGGDYPKELPIENGGTHIGMYLNWIIDKNLIGEIHQIDSKVGIEEVKSRRITGNDFLFKYCDEKFWEDDLNDEGLEFTKFYYQNPNDLEDPYGQYIDDYQETLGKEYESLYEIPNTWGNYDKISKLIDKRYEKWKRKGSLKWKFWKK